MDDNIKAKWVAALRSGNYPQGRGALKSEEGYCCLGVLCDVALGEGVVARVVSINDASDDLCVPDGDVFIANDGTSNWEVLPQGIADWAGLGDKNPLVRTEDDVTDSLANLNDDGATFDEIAGYIEASL